MRCHVTQSYSELLATAARAVCGEGRPATILLLVPTACLLLFSCLFFGIRELQESHNSSPFYFLF